ncbi:MAG: signal peptide peptidase SppA, partial [Phycisphaerae bacterium]|nr:signal peptide peptidase SppA [Phycisphaerae bacterium]
SLAAAFEQVRTDDRIKAVIFRIDSPGGSAVASELIYQAVRKCARIKPVIVSVSSMAASGGYYIAVGGETIIADPTALIGSIGVVSGKLAVSGLMEWAGVTRHEITRGKMAGLGMSRPWTKAELATIRTMSEKVYDKFVDRVATSRGKRVKSIHKVIQGRIFTARQAVANGMIDRVGGFNDAVIAAKKAAKIGACHYITLPRPRTLMDFLSSQGGAGASSLLGARRDALVALVRRSRGLAYLLDLGELFQREMNLTAMPYYVNIKP